MITASRGAKLICTPRPHAADDQQAVWQALARDALRHRLLRPLAVPLRRSEG